MAGIAAGTGGVGSGGACCKSHQLLTRKATSTCATTSGAGTPWAAPSAAESATYANDSMVCDRALAEAIRAPVERIMECLRLPAWRARFAAYGCRRNRSSSLGSACGAIVVESLAGSISARSRARGASAARSAC